MGNLEQTKGSKRTAQAVPLPELPWMKISYTPDDTDFTKAMKFMDQLNKTYGASVVALAYETVTKVNDLQPSSLDGWSRQAKAPKQGSAGISKEGEA